MRHLAVAVMFGTCLTTLAAPARAELRGPSVAPRAPQERVIEVRERATPPAYYGSPHLYASFGVAGALAFQQTGPRAYLHRGGGFQLAVGARLSRTFGLEVAWMSTYHENELVNTVGGQRINLQGMQALTGDLKLYPRSTGRVQPYFAGGGGMYWLGNNLNSKTSGPAWGLGFGVDVWLKPWARLGFKGMYRGVTFMEDGSEEGRTYMSLATGNIEFTARF